MILILESNLKEVEMYKNIALDKDLQNLTFK